MHSQFEPTCVCIRVCKIMGFQGFRIFAAHTFPSHTFFPRRLSQKKMNIHSIDDFCSLEDFSSLDFDVDFFPQRTFVSRTLFPGLCFQDFASRTLFLELCFQDFVSRTLFSGLCFLDFVSRTLFPGFWFPDKLFFK